MACPGSYTLSGAEPRLNPLRPLFPAVSARFERPTCQASPRPHLCWWSWGSFRGALKQSIPPCRREQATTKICAQAGNPSWDGKRQATSEWLDAGAILRHCEPSLSLKKNPAKMWRFSKKKNCCGWFRLSLYENCAFLHFPSRFTSQKITQDMKQKILGTSSHVWDILHSGPHTCINWRTVAVVSLHAIPQTG